MQFESDFGDLDNYTLAAIELPDRSQAWLIKYQGDEGDTLVRVDADAEPITAMKLLEQVLRLDGADFLWINPVTRLSAGIRA